MKSSAFIIFIAITFFSPFIINAQRIINLYPSTIPNAKTTTIKEVNSNGMFRSATTPTLEIYLPEKEKASVGTEDFLYESVKKNLAMFKEKNVNVKSSLFRVGIPG